MNSPVIRAALPGDEGAFLLCSFWLVEALTRAAAAAFRRRRPDLERMIGFGLCDGATALALHGADAGLDGWLLYDFRGVNPVAG